MGFYYLFTWQQPTPFKLLFFLTQWKLIKYYTRTNYQQLKRVDSSKSSVSLWKVSGLFKKRALLIDVSCASFWYSPFLLQAKSVLLWAMEHGGSPEKWAATQCLAMCDVITDSIISELVSQLQSDTAIRAEKAGVLLADLSQHSVRDSILFPEPANFLQRMFNENEEFWKGPIVRWSWLVILNSKCRVLLIIAAIPIFLEQAQTNPPWDNKKMHLSSAVSADLIISLQGIVHSLIAELLNSSSWKDRMTACKVIPKLKGGINKVQHFKTTSVHTYLQPSKLTSEKTKAKNKQTVGMTSLVQTNNCTLYLVPPSRCALYLTPSWKRACQS